MTQHAAVPTEAYTYTIVLEPDDDGGFVVSVPALPGCVTHGETVEHAREMAADAIAGCLQALRNHGEPIPPGESNPAEAG